MRTVTQNKQLHLLLIHNQNMQTKKNRPPAGFFVKHASLKNKR